MSEPMIRGHVLAHTARFARAHLELASPYGLSGSISGELSLLLENVTGAGWYPRRYVVELLRALADARLRSEESHRDLQRCGAALAGAENQFMALLMRVMTPQLFIRKMPLFWQRDHQTSGLVEVDPIVEGAKQAKVRLIGVSGYDHAAMLWLGWTKHLLDGLCGGGGEVIQTGWSWSDPGPGEVIFDVRWS